MSVLQSRRIRWVIAALGCAIAIGVIGISALRPDGGPEGTAAQRTGSQNTAARPATAHAALTVSTVRPVAILWPETVVANGAIAAWQEAVVAAEVAGLRLVELLVDVGDRVTAGQLLARFDPAPMLAAFAQQKASLAEANARLAEAEANSNRARQLHATQMISEQDLISATTRTDAAQAQVELARARLTTAQLNLDNTRVLAPDDGVISARSAMLGAVAAPGMELFRLVRQKRLEWRAELTGADIAGIEVGDRAEITLPDDSTVHGMVRQVAPTLDSGTRTGIVYVSLDAQAASSEARPGMFVTGRILQRDKAGISLPSSALVLRDGYSFVFVVDAEEGRAMQKKVVIGRRAQDVVEVLSGVSLDDAVIASGGAFLNDGDIVRVVAAQEAHRGEQASL
ncbi:MAG: efflux RND transporter periplasmic adaptor subunit [Pseudomonadales bacterium]|nr:efflux RND transporter periplasmic adaptor subunit [Pseudomonadales bacterium]